MICKLIKKLLCPDLYEEEKAIGKYKSHLMEHGKIEYVDIDTYNFTFMGHKIVREYAEAHRYNGFYYPNIINFVDGKCKLDLDFDEGKDLEAFCELAIKIQNDKLHNANKIYWEQQELWGKLPKWYKEQEGVKK